MRISLTVVRKGRIFIVWTLIEVMAWRWIERRVLISLGLTRPQWYYDDVYMIMYIIMG